ncbi:MAG: hypothetical protein JWN62_2777, partial [Acidimicrobiales bacterium]|nr:hypothetical protein [Acidimicrobiales bacterium]
MGTWSKWKLSAALLLPVVVLGAAAPMSAGAKEQSGVAVPGIGAAVACTTVNLALGVKSAPAVGARQALDDTPSYFVGDHVKFSLTITNSGPGVATGITVNTSVSAGLTLLPATAPAGSTYNDSTHVWSITSLAVGASSTIDLFATVGATGSQSFTATIVGIDEPDASSADDTATSTINVIDRPFDLTITNVFTPIVTQGLVHSFDGPTPIDTITVPLPSLANPTNVTVSVNFVGLTPLVTDHGDIVGQNVTYTVAHMTAPIVITITSSFDDA